MENRITVVLIALIVVLTIGVMAFAGTREQIVATSSTPVSFTKVTIREGATCVVRNGGYAIFVDWIGSAPTTTVGIPIQANESLNLSQQEFNNFSAIASSTTSTIYGMCN